MNTSYLIEPDYLIQYVEVAEKVSHILETSFTDASNVAHRQQHAPALPDGAAAAQEADEQQHGAHCNEQVGDVGQLGDTRRGAIHALQQTQQRTAVHLHPHSHAQDAHACQLRVGRGKKRETRRNSGQLCSADVQEGGFCCHHQEGTNVKNPKKVSL